LLWFEQVCSVFRCHGSPWLRSLRLLIISPTIFFSRENYLAT
jgi:hypothetical protein